MSSACIRAVPLLREFGKSFMCNRKSNGPIRERGTPQVISLTSGEYVAIDNTFFTPRRQVGCEPADRILVETIFDQFRDNNVMVNSVISFL